MNVVVYSYWGWQYIRPDARYGHEQREHLRRYHRPVDHHIFSSDLDHPTFSAQVRFLYHAGIATDILDHLAIQLCWHTVSGKQAARFRLSPHKQVLSGPLCE